MLTHFLLALVLATTSAAEHHNSEVPAASQKLLAFAIETQQSHAHFAAVFGLGFGLRTLHLSPIASTARLFSLRRKSLLQGMSNSPTTIITTLNVLPNLTDSSFHIQYSAAER